jgi:hypothetical protein
MTEKLFPETETNVAYVTCRNCIHRQRWAMGRRFIQYCGVRKSRRTVNGLLKIKVTRPACSQYKEAWEE